MALSAYKKLEFSGWFFEISLPGRFEWVCSARHKNGTSGNEKGTCGTKKGTHGDEKAHMGTKRPHAGTRRAHGGTISKKRHI